MRRDASSTSTPESGNPAVLWGPLALRKRMNGLNSLWGCSTAPRQSMSRIWLRALLLGALLLAGCGEERESASFPSASFKGKVSIDGKPVEKGSIEFFPEGGSAGQPMGYDIVNGEYDAPVVPLGQVRVQFNVPHETGEMMT